MQLLNIVQCMVVIDEYLCG